MEESKKVKEKKENQEKEEKVGESQKNAKDEYVIELEEKIRNLEEKLRKTEEQAKKLSLLYQNLQQDFERYKVRSMKEKNMAIEEGIEKFAKEILGIIDNFEKAIESAKISEDMSALTKGIQMIHYQLLNTLEKFGIQEIATEGQFNPEHHEAVDTYTSAEYKPNEIVKVLQKGYKYKEKVLRPAKVVVALPPEETEKVT